MGTKDKILMAAVELFAEKGFSATTTRDICAKAECNVAAVNYHYKGKEGLGSAVVDYLFQDYDERHSDFLNAPPPRSENDWRDMMVNFVRNFISDGEDEFRTSRRMRIIFGELNAPTALFHEMHERFMRPIQERLRHMIRLGLEEDADESEVDMWLITLMSQCVFFRKKHPPEMGFARMELSDGDTINAIARHIAGTLLCRLKFRGEQ